MAFDGYKGKNHHSEDVQVYLCNKSRKNMTRWERMLMSLLNRLFLI
ncbi:hypothetical protein LEP1GSC005_1238 [Leptospira santarosai str. ST188]|nr:hypothetical protein LEP1GSC005_1238 [Leptospira santarosai str. ST188]